MLGITRINVLAYADDIVLMAASLDEMGALYQQLWYCIKSHELIINKLKTKCMIFGNTNKAILENGSVKLENDEIEVVKTYKYLGHVIQGDMGDISGIELRLSKFYSSTNSVLRNFKNIDVETLLFLFTSYCKPVFGLNLLINKSTINSGQFKIFEVAYNNTLKRIMNVPIYSSSHEVAKKSGQLLLHHPIALLQGKYHRLLRNKCSPIKRNLPFFKCGLFFRNVDKLFKDKYDVDVPCHAPDILCSRITWVQKHEERRTLYIINMMN